MKRVAETPSGVARRLIEYFKLVFLKRATQVGFEFVTLSGVRVQPA